MGRGGPDRDHFQCCLLPAGRVYEAQRGLDPGRHQLCSLMRGPSPLCSQIQKQICEVIGNRPLFLPYPVIPQGRVPKPPRASCQNCPQEEQTRVASPVEPEGEAPATLLLHISVWMRYTGLGWTGVLTMCYAKNLGVLGGGCGLASH